MSKRLGSSYRSGRADCWMKVRNPTAPAVARKAEEESNRGVSRLVRQGDGRLHCPPPRRRSSSGGIHMPQFSTSYQRYGALWDFVICLNKRTGVICLNQRAGGDGVLLVKVVMVASRSDHSPIYNTALSCGAT